MKEIEDYKIGIIAYSSNTGLGYQTRLLAGLLKVSKVLIVDLSPYNGMPVNHSWVECDYRICREKPSEEGIQWLTDGVDLVFVCETPLNYELFNIAREKGVKTVLQYNPEFLDYFKDPNLPKPTHFVCPSSWMLAEAKNAVKKDVFVLRIPVEKVIASSKQQKTINVLHVAGRYATGDRNGTLQFLDMVENNNNRDLKFILTYQEPKEAKTIREFAEIQKRINKLRNKLKIYVDVEDMHEIYSITDIFVLPRKYGGLCLPQQEALAYSIPVLMPNIEPNYFTLPDKWLFNVKIGRVLRLKTNVIAYESDLQNMISKLNYVVQNLEREKEKARKIAKKLLWKNQKKNYQAVFNL